MKRPTLKLFSLKEQLININNDLDRISDFIYPCSDFNNVHKLTILLEDRRYFKHKGFDVKSFIREVFKKMNLKRHGGFSTIEMQLVRTITKNYEKTFSRKFYEIVLATLCNFHFSKIDMLNAYLKIAYLGTEYPVITKNNSSSNYESFSLNFFKKHPEELNLQEAAFIAACLVYPKPRMQTEKWKKKIKKRQKYGCHLYSRYEYIFNKVSI